jgi:hypothetical protein
MNDRAIASFISPWIVLFAVCICFTPHVNAQTYVSGPVSGTWTPGGSPYIATDTIEVLSGDNLHIQPGVDVLFDGPHALFVFGTLHAAGAPEDSISFAPLDPGSHWCGIRFIGSGEGSYITFSRISHSEATGDSLPYGVGGAIFIENASPLISHCAIDSCEASSYGNLWDGGGAICCIGGSPVIRANRITNCRAMAFCTGGGGAISFRESDIVITDNIIQGCSAHGLGGGIAGIDSKVEISRNVIFECSGFHYAGGIGLKTGCSGRIFDNLIVENEVLDCCGGGIYLASDSVEVAFCTIAFNSVPEGYYGRGGGLYVSGDPQPVIRNCIFWGNTVGDVSEQIHPENLNNVDYCDVEGGYPGSGNFDLDPYFVEAAGGVMHPGYYLSAIAAGQGFNSPCIDAGDCSAVAAGLEDRTTRTDSVPDADVVDLGYHHAVTAVTAAERLPIPVFLAQNYPNPFNPGTTIRFDIPDERRVRLTVHDVSGRLIAVLLDCLLPRGRHEVEWNGANQNGTRVGSGVYFYTIEASNIWLTKKMVLLR